MERGFWPWRGYAPCWSNKRPNDGWRLSQSYNFPNSWASQVRPPGDQLARAPLSQLHNRFPPAPGDDGLQFMQQSPPRAQERQTRNRRASSGELPGRDHAEQVERSRHSSAGPVSGRDSYATHSVCYVSDGQPRQVELKVPLLQIPKLFQRLPYENETIDRMAVSEPPSQVSNTSGAAASKAEHAPKAAEKPKACKASVPPMAAQASSEGMDVPALSSKVPKVNSAASKDEHAVPKKTKACTVVGSKLVSVRESQTSEPTPPQVNEKPVLEAPSQVSDAKVKSSAVARKTDHAATKPKKLGASSAVSSKPVPESKSCEPPSQASHAKVNPSSAVARKTDHAAPKAKKLEAPSAVSSKSIPESESSELTPSHTTEETVVLEPPDQTSNKAKANVSNVVARETDHGASAEPSVSSVTDSKFIPVRVFQAQSAPVPPQDRKVQPSDQAHKAEASPSNAAPRKTAQAPTAPTKPKVSSVTGSKLIPARVTQTSESMLPQVSLVTDSKPIPVWVSGSVPAHRTSSAGRKPAASQKRQNPGDYEDVSDVPLEEYCDDTSSEVSQVEQGVVSGASCEQPRHKSCDKEEAARLGDYEDVSDTPLTMYDSPEKSCSSVQPAHRKATARRHSGEGVAKGPPAKKKVPGSTPAAKKAEEKCVKALNASPSQQQAAAKPKPAATNKVKVHPATKQGAAQLTATTAATNSEPSAAGNGATKKHLKRPGTPCSHQDVKKRKVDTSSEKRKPDTCASTTQQNGSPAPAKKVERVLSCTKISTKPSMAKSNNEEATKDSPRSAPSTTQQDSSPAPAKKLAAKKIEKAVSCTKISPKPSMANSNKEATKDSPRSAPSTTQQNGSSAPAKKLAAKKIEKAASCTKISAKPCMTNSNSNEETSKDSPMSTPKLEASKGVGTKNKSTPKEEASKDVGAKNKSEPTSAKMLPKADTGHSSVTSTQKKDSAQGVCSSKPTPPGKAHVTKSSKSTSPGEASVMKSNKNPLTYAATKAKGKSNCFVPNTLLTTVGSPNSQTPEAPPERPPRPPSSKATVKCHTLSSEVPPTKACKSPGSSAMPAQHQDMSEVPEPQLGKDDPAKKAECSGSRPPQPSSSKATVKSRTFSSEATSTKACKSSGSSATPVQRQDVSKVPEPQLGKDDLAQKAECSGSTRTAPVCPSISGVRPGSSLKPCHTSKTKELSSGAMSCATPRKREMEAKGTPCSVADGQPGVHTSQEPIGSIEEQKSIPVENRCLDMPKGGQSCDTLQASAQKKTKAVKVSGIKGDMKKLGTAKEIEDRCDSPLTKSCGTLQASGVQKTQAATTATTVKVSGIKGDMKNSGAAKKIEDRCDSPSTSNVAAERNHSAGKLPTSGNAVKTKHPASKLVDKAAETAADKEVFTKALNDIVCSSLNQEAESTSVPQPADEDATVPSEENMVEDQAGGLMGSKTAAASPRYGESLKQVQESSVVSSPSSNVAERVQTNTNVAATQEADRTSGMLPPGSNSRMSPAGTAALANGNCESLETSTGTSTLTSPLRESACDKPSLTQQSDDSRASIIGSIQPRKESPVPLDAPASAKTTKKGDGNESPSACDVSTQEPVKGVDPSQKPPPGEEAVGDTRRENTASTEESDQHKGQQLSTSPPQQLQGDCPMTTTQGSYDGEQDACAALSKGDAATACKPDYDVEGPATSSHQDKAIKPSPPKKKNKNKGPGTNTSLRSAWLFTRKKRGKRRRSSTEMQSGSSPKKFKAADSSQGSSKITGEPSASAIAIKTEPADDNDTEAMFPLVAPPAQRSARKMMLRTRQAHSSREDREPTGNSAKKLKASDLSQDGDPVAQSSSSKFTREPSTSLIKKEPGTEDDVDTEAALLLNAAGALCSPRRLASPAVRAYHDRNLKPTAPARSAESPPACGRPSEPSSSSDSASAKPLTPMEVAQMDLDMFSGLCILDVCGCSVAELRERLQASSITRKDAVGMVAKAVHKAVLDEYFKREHAVRTLKLLAKVPFSLDSAKVTKIQQLTQAIVERPRAGGKP